jgi:uncharacterized protein YigA (DUF484 family)
MSQISNTSDIPVLTALTSDQVSDYLQRNPDFFVDKPALLADITLPHDAGGETISLVERQVAVLRDRNMDMRHRLSKLLDNARNNDMLFEKTRRLVLSLLDTKQFDDCLDALFFGFQDDFDIHYSRILLIDPSRSGFPVPANQQARIVSLELAEEHLSSIIKNKRAICGQLDSQEKEFIFADNANIIGSTAIAPLRVDNRFLGLLAIASRDPNYYRSSMNTLFINFIADALSRLLSDYLQPVD